MPPTTPPLKFGGDGGEQHLRLRRPFGSVKTSNRIADLTAMQQRTPNKAQYNPSKPSTTYFKDATILAPPVLLASRKRRFRPDEGATGGIGTTVDHQQQQQQLRGPPSQTSSNTAAAQKKDGGGENAGESDIVKNGRALYKATTTTLEAPLELTNKRIKRLPFDHNNNSLVHATTSAAGASTSANLGLATPSKAASSQQQQYGNSTASLRQGAPALSAAAAATAASKTFAKPSTTSQLKKPSSSSTSKARTSRQYASTTIAAAKAARDEEKRAIQEQAALEWKRSYKKAFKGFVFFFDDVDDKRKQVLVDGVNELGANVSATFLRTVTHVVTTRQVPAAASSKAGSGSSMSALSAGQSQTVPKVPAPASATSIFAATGKENVKPTTRNSSESPVKATVAGRRLAKTAGPAAAGIGSMKTPPKQMRPFHDVDRLEAQSSNILTKAVHFGMKVWSIEKAQRVVERLLDAHSPSKALINQNFQAGIANDTDTNAIAAFQYEMQGATGAFNQPITWLHTSKESTASATHPQQKLSLPSLLRAEALTGSTYERDQRTLRPDYNYFNPKNGYLLVEDSSGEFQPCHTKEYDQRAYPKSTSAEGAQGQDRDTEWPTLWGGQEGRGAFFKPSASHTPPLPNLQLMAVNQCQDPRHPPYKLNKHGRLEPTVYHGEYQSNLKRSASLSSLHAARLAKQPALGNSNVSSSKGGNGRYGARLDSYQIASGNSQIITSNINSATSTTTTRSGQIIGNPGANGATKSLATGIIVDKRLARLGSKARKHIVTVGGGGSGTGSGSGNGAPGAVAREKAVHGGSGNNTNDGAAAPEPDTTLYEMTYENSELALVPPKELDRELRRKGQLEDAEANKKVMTTWPHVNLNPGLGLVGKAIRPPANQPKKPGYCENCRQRYDDFKTHTKSRKHRRFALDNNNWVELDDLLTRISRPVLPELLELYEAAGCEVPSDIEASDDEESDDNDFSDDDEADEDEEGGERPEEKYEFYAEMPQEVIDKMAYERYLQIHLGHDESGFVDDVAPVLDRKEETAGVPQEHGAVFHHDDLALDEDMEEDELASPEAATSEEEKAIRSESACTVDPFEEGEEAMRKDDDEEDEEDEEEDHLGMYTTDHHPTTAEDGDKDEDF